MLGARLRQSRDGRGFSRRDLSEKSGIDQTTIYKIETGKIKNPNLSTIGDLARALEIDVFYLLGATDDPVPKKVEEDKITVMKDISMERARKTLEEFKEISERLEKAHLAKGGKTRPYYPLYIDIPADEGEIVLEELDYSKIRGHINIEYYEQVDYILSVKGNAMAPFVEDGGLIFVRKYEPGTVKDEDIALFHIRERTITLVRQAFYHKIDQILNVGLRSFQPRNTEWFPLSADIISCQGKVVGTVNDRKEVERLLSSIERRP
jgi:transcriptional regulator with XRE-family HTH domain